MAAGDKIQLRQGPSGTFLEGTADDDVPLWDNTEKRWGAGPAPATPLRNLTKVAYVDNGGTPPATPNGNIESPWATFDDAQASNPQAMWVTPGSYAGEGTIAFTPTGCSVRGIPLSPQEGTFFFQSYCPILPALDMAPPGGNNEYLFENVRVSIVGSTAAVNTISFRNCIAQCSGPASYGVYVEGGSFDGNVGSQGIFAKDGFTQLGVNLTTGAIFNRFTNWDFRAGGILFDVAGGTAELDIASVCSLHRSSLSIGNGGVQVLDGPRLQFQWGAQNVASGDFLNPGTKSGTGNAALTLEWFSLSGTLGPAGEAFAHVIHAQLAAAHTDDVVCTLFVGATIAGAAATALTCTIPAGQTTITTLLNTELVIVPPGGYMGVQFTSANPLAANALEVLVGLT